MFDRNQTWQSQRQVHPKVDLFELIYFISFHFPLWESYMQSFLVLPCPCSSVLHLFGPLALSLDPGRVCPLESKQSELFIAGEAELKQGQGLRLWVLTAALLGQNSGTIVQNPTEAAARYINSDWPPTTATRIKSSMSANVSPITCPWVLKWTAF